MQFIGTKELKFHISHYVSPIYSYDICTDQLNTVHRDDHKTTSTFPNKAFMRPLKCFVPHTCMRILQYAKPCYTTSLYYLGDDFIGTPNMNLKSLLNGQIITKNTTFSFQLQPFMRPSYILCVTFDMLFIRHLLTEKRFLLGLYH